jgi:hypothetical protein
MEMAQLPISHKGLYGIEGGRGGGGERERERGGGGGRRRGRGEVKRVRGNLILKRVFVLLLLLLSFHNGPKEGIDYRGGSSMFRGVPLKVREVR